MVDVSAFKCSHDLLALSIHLPTPTLWKLSVVSPPFAELVEELASEPCDNLVISNDPDRQNVAILLRSDVLWSVHQIKIYDDDPQWIHELLLWLDYIDHFSVYCKVALTSCDPMLLLKERMGTLQLVNRTHVPPYMELGKVLERLLSLSKLKLDPTLFVDGDRWMQIIADWLYEMDAHLFEITLDLSSFSNVFEALQTYVPSLKSLFAPGVLYRWKILKVRLDEATTVDGHSFLRERVRECLDPCSFMEEKVGTFHRMQEDPEATWEFSYGNVLLIPDATKVHIWLE